MNSSETTPKHPTPGTTNAQVAILCASMFGAAACIIGNLYIHAIALAALWGLAGIFSKSAQR